MAKLAKFSVLTFGNDNVLPTLGISRLVGVVAENNKGKLVCKPDGIEPPTLGRSEKDEPVDEIGDKPPTASEKDSSPPPVRFAKFCVLTAV